MGGRLRVVCIPYMIVLESRWSFSALTGLIHPHRDQVRKLRRMHIVTVVSISSFFFFFFFFRPYTSLTPLVSASSWGYLVGKREGNRPINEGTEGIEGFG